MARKINIYNDNPTAGATDGVAVSGGGTYNNPIAVELDAGNNEEFILTLAVRTEHGYQTYGSTTIYDANDTNDRWQLSLSPDGGWSDSITIGDVIGNSNVIFYAKARASASEYAKIDRTAKFYIDCQIDWA